ncbi:MAG: hypothetical protein QHH75_06235 [Bacillota bacterium]|nr:hypothetical protein [Bacillota bacterium]
MTSRKRIVQVWSGSRNDIYVKHGSIFYHYDGSRWSEWTLPGFEAAGQLLVSSARDIYALAKDQTIRHYDGAGWSLYSAGGDMLSGRQIKQIGLDAGKRLWVLYDENPDEIDDGQMGLAYQDGGGQWRETALPFITTNIDQNERSNVFVMNGNNIYIIQRIHGLFHYDGQNWRAVTGTREEDVVYGGDINDSGLQLVTGNAYDNLFVAGGRGRLWYSGRGIFVDDPGPSPGQPDGNIRTVSIRIEGYDTTFVPKTSVTVDNFDLTPYLGPASGSSATESQGWGPDRLKKPTVAHAHRQSIAAAGYKF